MSVLQRTLEWMWALAARKGAERALAVVSFSEAIFFPLPPDLMLIPMALARREQSFRLATICLVWSILGGVAGYALGYFFMEAVGNVIINWYHLGEKYRLIQNWYDAYSAWAVAIAGLTPIPYKLCTLTAGAFAVNPVVFVVASVLSRGARFYAIAAAAYFYGEQARLLLERRLNTIIVIVTLLAVLGFVILKLVL